MQLWRSLQSDLRVATKHMFVVIYNLYFQGRKWRIHKEPFKGYVLQLQLVLHFASRLWALGGFTTMIHGKGYI
jgi:hypothetical protein